LASLVAITGVPAMIRGEGRSAAAAASVIVTAPLCDRVER